MQRRSQDPTAELADFLDTLKGPAAVSPQNPLSQQAAPSANQANPMMNPNNPGAFNNPSNPQLNPDLPGSTTNPSNPQYNPGMPGAENNPANPTFNPGMPGATNNPSNPQLNPSMPGSITNPANPIHNPDYPDPSQIGQPPSNLGPNASFPPKTYSVWNLAALETECQTPDAVYDTAIGDKDVKVDVKLPHALDLDEGEAELLEKNIHNVMELALAPHFRQADNYTQDTREWADPTEPRASKPPMQMGCTCPEGHKLDCPIHGMDAENADADHTWFLPQGWPIGYPQDQPRGWTDAVQSSHHNAEVAHDSETRYTTPRAQEGISPSDRSLQGLPHAHPGARQASRGQAADLPALPHREPRVAADLEEQMRWKGGGCGALAHHLHGQTGWPIVGALHDPNDDDQRPDHFAVLHPSGDVLDINGLSEWDDWHHRLVEPEELEAHMNEGLLPHHADPEYADAPQVARRLTEEYPDEEHGWGFPQGRVAAGNPEVDWVAQNYPQFQHVGYNANGHPQYVYPDTNGNGHLVTGWIGGGSKKQAIQNIVPNLKRQMYKCLNGACDHVFALQPGDVMGEPAQVPPEPEARITPGTLVSHEGQPHYVTAADTIDGTHIYDLAHAQTGEPTEMVSHEELRPAQADQRAASVEDAQLRGGHVADIVDVDAASPAVPVGEKVGLASRVGVDDHHVEAGPADVSLVDQPVHDVQSRGVVVGFVDGVGRSGGGVLRAGTLVVEGDSEHAWRVPHQASESPFGVTLRTMRRDGYSEEDIEAWGDYLAAHNEADRDSGELDDVPDEQVERWCENWETEGRPRVASRGLGGHHSLPEPLEAVWAPASPGSHSYSHRRVREASTDCHPTEDGRRQSGRLAAARVGEVWTGPVGGRLQHMAGVELDGPASWQMTADRGHLSADQLLSEGGAGQPVEDGFETQHDPLNIHAWTLPHQAMNQIDPSANQCTCHLDNPNPGQMPQTGERTCPVHGDAIQQAAFNTRAPRPQQPLTPPNTIFGERPPLQWPSSSEPWQGMRPNRFGHQFPPNGTHQCPGCGQGSVSNGWTGWTPMTNGEFGQRSWQCPSCGVSWKDQQPLPVGHPDLRLAENHHGVVVGDHVALAVSGGVGQGDELVWRIGGKAHLDDGVDALAKAGEVGVDQGVGVSLGVLGHEPRVAAKTDFSDGLQRPVVMHPIHGPQIGDAWGSHADVLAAATNWGANPPMGVMYPATAYKPNRIHWYNRAPDERGQRLLEQATGMGWEHHAPQPGQEQILDVDENPEVYRDDDGEGMWGKQSAASLDFSPQDRGDGQTAHVWYPVAMHPVQGPVIGEPWGRHVDILAQGSGWGDRPPMGRLHGDGRAEWYNGMPDERAQRLLEQRTGQPWQHSPMSWTAANQMYHVAPTTERARIQQHGLMPADPYHDQYKFDQSAWHETHEERPPVGVYAMPDPADAQQWRQWWEEAGQPSDVWEFSGQGMEDPDVEGAQYVTHPVRDPRLHSGPERWAAKTAASSLWFKPRGREWGKGLYHIPTQTLITWPEGDNIEHQGMAHQMGWQTGQDTRTLDITPDGIVHPRGPMEDEHAQSIGVIDPRLAVQPRTAWTWEASYTQTPANMPSLGLSTLPRQARSQAHTRGAAQNDEGPPGEPSRKGQRSQHPQTIEPIRRGHPRSAVHHEAEVALQPRAQRQDRDVVHLVQPAVDEWHAPGGSQQAIPSAGQALSHVLSPAHDPLVLHGQAVRHWSQPAAEPRHGVVAKQVGHHAGSHDDDGVHAGQRSKPSVLGMRAPLLGNRGDQPEIGWSFGDRLYQTSDINGSPKSASMVWQPGGGSSPHADDGRGGHWDPEGQWVPIVRPATTYCPVHGDMRGESWCDIDGCGQKAEPVYDATAEDPVPESRWLPRGGSPKSASMAWQPGGWGKGLTVDGRPHTWPTEGPGGSPHHQQYLQQIGRGQPETDHTRGVTDGAVIAPDGSYTLQRGFQRENPVDPSLLARVQSGMRYMPDQDRWARRAFGSLSWSPMEVGPGPGSHLGAALPFLPWRPGNFYGKGLITPQGRVMRWSTGLERDGSPSHSDVVQKLGLGSNPFGDVDPNVHYFAMNPDGRLRFVLTEHGGDPKPAMVQKIVDSHPALSVGPDSVVDSSNLPEQTARTGMAADPHWVDHWMERNGPYLYHNTYKDNIPSILQNGLVPWDHPSNPGASTYAGTPSEPRANHVYMRSAPIAGDYIRVDMRKLNPVHLNPDEDNMGSGDYAQFPEVPDVGPYVDPEGWSSVTRPSQTAWSLEGGGTIAHNGLIPPEAIDWPWGHSSAQQHLGAQSTMGWQPGGWGKGLILDGQLHTWPTDGGDVRGGAPHHGEILTQNGIPDWHDDHSRWSDTIVINPEGYYVHNAFDEDKTPAVTRFAQAHPALKYDPRQRRMWSKVGSEGLLPIRMHGGCPSCGGPHIDEESGECTDCGYTIPYDGAEQLEGFEKMPPYMREGPGTVGEWDTTGLEPHWGSLVQWRRMSETDSDAFEGKMYHGSPNGHLGPVRTPFWATSHEGEAQGFAAGRGGVVHPVSVRFQRPMHLFGEMRQMLAPSKFDTTVEMAQGAGHDGIVVHHPEDMRDPSDPYPKRTWTIALDPGSVVPGHDHDWPY